jgi:hypothetical protein
VDLPVIRWFFIWLVLQIRRFLQLTQWKKFMEFVIGVEEANGGFFYLLGGVTKVEICHWFILDWQFSKLTLLRNVFILGVVVRHAQGLIFAHSIIIIIT